jgi:hypothetical protein
VQSAVGAGSVGVCYNNGMRFRLGLVVGFGAGYYLGARAGRGRYEQIRSTVARIRDSRVTEKVQAVGALGLERLRRDQRIDLTVVPDAVGSPSLN